MAEGKAPPPFTFQRRTVPFDWRKIASIDLDRVVAEVDTDALNSVLNILTFGDIREEDLYIFSLDNFLHLYKLCQLTLEYLLYTQNYLVASIQELEGKLKAAEEKRMEAETLVKIKDEKLRQLKKELKTTKAALAAAAAASSSSASATVASTVGAGGAAPLRTAHVGERETRFVGDRLAFDCIERAYEDFLLSD